MSLQSPPARRVRTPRWFDARLVLGVLLVLASVAIGARVVASADSTAPVWQSSRALAAGAVIGSGDLRQVRVRLDDSASAYFGGADRIVGEVLVRDVAAGELIPRAAVGRPDGDMTTVTVPLQAGEAPKLVRGQRVQLWLSSRSCPATVVLDAVTVQDVQTGSGGLANDGSQSAVVRVPATLAQRVVTALGIRDVTLRAVVLGSQSAGAGPAVSPAASPDGGGSDLAACGGSGA